MSWEQQALRRTGRLLLASALSLALVVPSADASGSDLWKECRDGKGVSVNHPQEDFDDALANPPADGAEYSDCEDQIKTAQARSLAGGDTGTGGTPGGGSPGTGTGTGTGTTAVAPQALQEALAAEGVNPAAPPAPQEQAPPPVTVDGETIDLSEGSLPSLGGVISLPLPIAASAVVVLVSAALPIARYLAARYGGPPTGTTPAS